MIQQQSLFCLFLFCILPITTTTASQKTLHLWDTLTLAFDGPFTSELNTTRNPFLDYRLTVTFTLDDSAKFIVPGYFAADGKAANTGSSSGNQWHVKFVPSSIGTWKYSVAFVTGTNVAIQNDTTIGESSEYMDGTTGEFTVVERDATHDKSINPHDFRRKGRLEYVGEHYLQFAGTGKEWFVKGGADSPENLLAYADFDNTPNEKGYLKTWEAHVQDYKETTDPTWGKDGKGKGLIGAMNYLSSKGMNAMSFLTFNVGGDDGSVFPFVSNNDFTRMDVSKLAQWEVIFTHADHVGLFLHFKTQETEMDHLLEETEQEQNGDDNDVFFANSRKLYYRELIARFSHHLALNWNLGEENVNTDEQRKAFANYIRSIDPYHHPIVVHTYPGLKENAAKVYDPLLGFPNLDGASLQIHPNRVFRETSHWLRKSARAGHKWVVANDEQGDHETGVKPDADDPNHDSIRRKVLWGNLMAGGAGVEYYFGYKYSHSDLKCEDWRSRDRMWDQTRYALEFFTKYIPFWEMKSANNLLLEGSGYVFVKKSDDSVLDILVVFLKEDAVSLDLTAAPTDRSYSVEWYDSKLGGDLTVNKTLAVIQGGQNHTLVRKRDAVALLKCQGCSSTTTETTTTPTSAPSVLPREAPTSKPSPGSSMETVAPKATKSPVVPPPEPTRTPMQREEKPIAAPVGSSPVAAPEEAPTSKPSPGSSSMATEKTVAPKAVATKSPGTPVPPTEPTRTPMQREEKPIAVSPMAAPSSSTEKEPSSWATIRATSAWDFLITVLFFLFY